MQERQHAHLYDLHLGQGEAAGAHGHTAVTWGRLDAAVVIRVGLIAGVPDDINFICNKDIWQGQN